MKKLSFEQFEQLTENAEGQLVSGFSATFEGEALTSMGGNLYCPTNTNCHGGNCVAGCGGGDGGEGGSGH